MDLESSSETFLGDLKKITLYMQRPVSVLVLKHK
jgi:hypothetical protein